MDRRVTARLWSHFACVQKFVLLLAMGPWAGYLTSSCLSCLIGTMEKIIIMAYITPAWVVVRNKGVK